MRYEEGRSPNNIFIEQCNKVISTQIPAIPIARTLILIVSQEKYNADCQYSKLNNACSLSRLVPASCCKKVQRFARDSLFNISSMPP